MDAARRKEAWISIEDDMWELEVRWQWLLAKVQEGRVGNLIELGTAGSSEPSEVEKEEAGLQEQVKGTSSVLECSSLSEMDPVSSLVQYLKSFLMAVQVTSDQMATVKELTWHYWEDDSVSESFYDALQYSQQLLGNLTSTWGITVSIMRSKHMDTLYRSEKLVSQVALSHQLSVELIMAFWQSYLAVYNRIQPCNVTVVQIRARASCHLVGHCYSKVLLDSHALTLSIAERVKKISQLESVSNQTRETGSPNLASLFKPSSEFLKTGECSQSCLREMQDGHPENIQRVTRQWSAEKDAVANPVTKPSPSLAKLSKWKIKRYAFQKPQVKSCQSSHTSVLSQQCLQSSQYRHDTHDQNNSSKNMCCQLCMETACSSFMYGLHREESCPLAVTEGDASQPVCSCCCKTSKQESDTQEQCEDSSNKSCQSSCSDSAPKFTLNDWETLIDDVRDLQAELESLKTSLTQAVIEESFIVKLQACTKENILTQGEDVLKGTEEERIRESLSKLPLEECVAALISSQLSSLSMVEMELTKQVSVWQERESYGMLRSHIKGLDPEEAFMQAKALLNQHMEAFFSLMLLVKCTFKWRLLHYSALLCEALAEARSHAYCLVLSRSTVSKKTGKENTMSDEHPLEEEVKEVDENTASATSTPSPFVNPHGICQAHSLTLARAHAFCSTLINFLSDNSVVNH